MFLSSMHENASPNIPAYVFEIQQLFRRENLPIGTEHAMLAIADGLTNGTELRTNLGLAVRAIIRREDGQINAMELLSLILAASAGPVDPLPSVRMERAMHETLGFILEVRQQLENSGEGELGEGLVHGKERPTSWPQPLISPSLLEKLSSGGRSRVMLMLALCGLLAAFLLVGLSKRRQQAMENAGAQTHALSTSGSGNASNLTASVVSPARGTGSLPSHNWQFRSKAKAQKAEKSEVHRTSSSQNTSPAEVRMHSLPIGEFRSHSASASANNAVSPVSNSITHPKADPASPAQPRRTVASSVSTAVVAHAISVSDPKSDNPPRGLVQSGSAGIMAANLIWSPTPAYPAAASEARVEGEVTVNALVGKDGNVLSATVVSGPPLLREAALNAVAKWQYHPYLISGKPAVMATTAIVEFELAHN